MRHSLIIFPVGKKGQLPLGIHSRSHPQLVDLVGHSLSSAILSSHWFEIRLCNNVQFLSVNLHRSSSSQVELRAVYFKMYACRFRILEVETVVWIPRCELADVSMHSMLP